MVDPPRTDTLPPIPAPPSDAPRRVVLGPAPLAPAAPIAPVRPPINRQRVIGQSIALALALLAVFAGSWLLADQLNPRRGVGPLLTPEDQGRTHIAVGQPHPTYSSSPATSGWHREEWPPTRIMTTTVEDEVSVHMMEHGNVFVFYDCSATSDCATLQGQLAKVVQSELDARAGEGVYLAPRPLPDKHLVALAAWAHLQYLDRFNAEVAHAFINSYTGAMNESKPVLTPTP